MHGGAYRCVPVGFLNDVIRTLRVARKADAKTYKASLRIVFLGFALLGSVGYLFQLIGAGLRMATVGPLPSDTVVIVLAAMAAAVLGVALYLRRRAA